MKSVYINTNGCVEGQIFSKTVERFFKINNCIITKNLVNADIIIFYACGLTKFDEESSLDIIKTLQANLKPTAKLIVWGCLPKQNPQSLATLYDGAPIGVLDTDYFERLLEKPVIPFDSIEVAACANELESLKKNRQDKTIPIIKAIRLFKFAYEKAYSIKLKKTEPYYIQVETGCEGHCTYCSEHNVFGRIKSRPMNNIISEFHQGLKQDYNRFSLLATDVGSYGKDRNCTLSELIENMIKSTDKENYSFILNQMEPLHLIAQYSDLEGIFASGRIEEFMCPVESGSNRILELMGRGYTVEEWKEYMQKIHKRFPNIRLDSQFMVGFPTETEEDFKATLNLFNPPLFIEDLGIFKFSSRPNTYASRLPGQVPENIKDQRYVRLLHKYWYMYGYNNIRENKILKLLIS